MNINNSFEGLAKLKNYQVKRISSYDVTGGNADAWKMEPGEAKVLADIDGPGVISHIWFTVNSPDPLSLRKLLFRVYWDGEKNPSIDSPLGDFFGLGHGRRYTYQCAIFNTSSNEEGALGASVAMNCWLPMPFNGNAKIEVVNEQEEPVNSLYFYIDCQFHSKLEQDIGYLHAKWRRENPCDGWSGKGSVWQSPPWHERMLGNEGKNLSDEENYLILDAQGVGHYIGTNFSIDHLYKGWWGEGDDMIFIDQDGERVWPPQMHGTGSEDYLGHAWGMQKVAHMYNGQAWAEQGDYNNWGKVCVYRYHIVDPIPFTKNIRVSIEHGHANNRSDDWSSVAYWYQKEPHKDFAPMLPVKHRLPNL